MSHGYDDEEGIDDGEDRHSDEGSEDEAGYNEMEYYLQRCSICFDARLDFCLEYCRDQFCRDCFQRYVKEVVSNSWGLNVTKIKCPVCQDIISMSEWTKYVDKATLAQYNQYNQPYRSFSRFCNQCDHEMVVSQVNCALLTMPPRELMPLFDGILADLKLLLTLGGIELDDITPASSLSSPAKATSGHASTTKSKQRPIISERDQKARNIIQSRSTRPGVITRAESKRQVEIKKAIVHLSKQLSSMETRQEQWKELQFLHVRWLRWDRCTNCDHELCLQCGESSHHNSEDCFEHMRSLITETNGLDLSTIQWKLANTNPCPNCCILIHRDDGCNKVDCMLCGYRFCWICREPWGAACGFFKCGRRAVVAVDSNLGRSISNMNEGSTDALMTTQGQIAEDGQVRSPSTAHGFSDDVVQSQVEVQHVLESMPAATSEKVY
ncbi:hypothetical protein BC939DRAFT_404548 [Gamsiella multidivaricata]|uniref:uncharacterized protein n=1 Tax=Gamsiella multidivaricata TaxID=101098 RepID=UPI00221EBD51|nr:uncharacterized protein BC939DRAFT_404548 [Gamsiella multidivaricata]KAI7815911.1 hypothetical protein BC939DRAFT_404548 [Gamsiella multidivaricata]